MPEDTIPAEERRLSKKFSLYNLFISVKMYFKLPKKKKKKRRQQRNRQINRTGCNKSIHI